MPARPKPPSVVLLSILVLAAAAACVRAPNLPPTVPTTPGSGARRPNVVRILTDDQDVSSLRFMTKTLQLLAAKGTTYTSSTVSLSLCCPSRTTALTGQYAHNHGVVDNGGALGGYLHFTHQENTLAPWLRAGGYATAHVGKYMNQYGKSRVTEIPPGWDDWFTVVDEATESYPYWGYTVSDNGTARTYGTADADYFTDVFGQRALQSLRSLEGSGKPFFLDFWPTAPHSGRGRVETKHLGPAPAPRHEQANPGLQAPRSENFLPAKNEIPPTLNTMGVLYQWAAGGTAGFPQLLDDSYRDYVNSLLAVDEVVESFVQELEVSGQLDNTVIIFTSDNGLMWGNHNLTEWKWEPYEESLRVPLIIRGPGFASGATDASAVSNIDIVPTILQATGVPAGRVIDGSALQPTGATAARADRAVLVESNFYDRAQPYQFPGYKVPRFAGVRTVDFQYTEWVDGFVELFDLRADPAQMHNVATDPAHAGNRSTLATALHQLQTCTGTSCTVTVPGLVHP